jgi:hypothetical protein
LNSISRREHRAVHSQAGGLGAESRQFYKEKECWRFGDAGKNPGGREESPPHKILKVQRLAPKDLRRVQIYRGREMTYGRRKVLLIMSVRENVHRIVDTLPEERLDDVLDYLAEMSEPDEPLSAETRAAIEGGLDDIRSGRTIGLEEYRQKRGR